MNKHQKQIFSSIFLLLILYGCSSKLQTKIDETHTINDLISRLNNPQISIQEKKSIIMQLGFINDISVIPELNKVLLRDNESELWMITSEALEKLGVKDAIEAQKEYEKIRTYEKDFYYVKNLEGSDSDITDPQKYKKIIEKFSAWVSRYPNHPKAPSIEISIKYFEKIFEKVTIEKVYMHPKKYLSNKIQWQGIIKDINMQENRVKFELMSGNKKWYVLLDAVKFIPEIHKIGMDIKIYGDIIDFTDEPPNKIPVVYMKNFW